jgi:hypothetical protein
MLLGQMRGTKKVIELSQIVFVLSLFQWISLYFSSYNPFAKYFILELEINPFCVVNNSLVPVDGVLSVIKNKNIYYNNNNNNNNNNLCFSPSLPLSRIPKPLYKVKNLFCYLFIF